MPGPINRIPQGLLSLLDVKALGRNPSLLSDQVIGTLDLFPQYELQSREVVIGQTNPLATGVVGFYVDTSSPERTRVPEGEVWYVSNVTYQSLAALNITANSLAATAALQRRALIGAELLINESQPFREFLNTWVFADSVNRPFWMLPGDILGLMVHRAPTFAVQPNIGIRAQISRFLI